MSETTALQASLRAALSSSTSAAASPSPTGAFDAIVAHVEVTTDHGVGVLLKRLFDDVPRILSIRSQDQFGGRQQFGDWNVRLEHRSAPRPMVYRNVISALPGIHAERVLAVPYFPDDVRTAIALADIYGAPLCTWLMDDQNVIERSIPDALMRELLNRSRVRFAISGVMRDAYEEKFGLEMGVLPPTVSPHLIQGVPVELSSAMLTPSRGAIVGNVWGQHWLSLLRKALRTAGLQLDWFCNSGARWLPCSETELAADGINFRGALPTEEQLKAELQDRPFAVVTSGTLGPQDDRRAIATLSLPSRIVFIAACTGTPVLVLGSRDTGAARFVERHGIGTSAGYDAGAIRQAIARLLDPAEQHKMRTRAADLGPSFSSSGLRDWLWRSVELERPADQRFEDLFPRCSRLAAAGGRISEERCFS